MAISPTMFKEILRLKSLGFFNEINSVMDMGDQDVNVHFDDINFFTEQVKLEFDHKIINRSKFFPERPRISSSTLWELLGIKETNRMDLLKIKREDKKDENKVIIHNLNYFFNNESFLHKFDLVTDFGNNEHPFNITESFKTMHNLAKEKGYLWTTQEVFNGNGFYNLDTPFFENIALANKYDIILSAYILKNSNGLEDVIVPCEKPILKMIDFAKVQSIGIYYIFKKNNLKEFIFPNQGSGAIAPPNINYLKYAPKFNLVNKNFLARNYIPHKKINKQNIIKRIIKKILLR